MLWRNFHHEEPSNVSSSTDLHIRTELCSSNCFFFWILLVMRLSFNAFSVLALLETSNSNPGRC
uniref:Uncharacterized protein n=1 Tax=Manihot esculenta TaxID=3983 RepID=A0A2C9V0G0_MANES